MTTKKATSKKTSKKVSKKATGETSVNQAQKVSAPIASSPAPAPLASKRSGGVLATLSLLLSVGALAGAGFTWYDIQVRQVSEESKLVSDVAAVGSQVSILGERVENLQRDRDALVSSDQLELRLVEAQTQANEELGEVRVSADQLAERLAVLSDAFSQGGNEFLLDDVGQLLKAANISALVLGDRDGALNALRIAEQQLLDLADPRFTAVRQGVLNDIAALEAVELADINKLSIALQGLIDRVEGLELANEPEETSTELLSLADQPTEVSGGGFSEGVREMARDFLSLFTIKVQRVDQPPTPLLSPDKRYFLNLNLMLSLNKAELAALQGRPQVFTQSLMQAKSWVGAFFDVGTPSVAQFLADIEALESTQLDVELPSVAQGYSEFVTVRGEQ